MRRARLLFVCLVVSALVGCVPTSTSAPDGADEADSGALVDGGDAGEPLDCSVVGCAAPPACGEACLAPCGCCVDPGCASCSAGRPTAVAPLPSPGPSTSEWSADLVVDTSACTAERRFVALPLGSAWVLVQPSADGTRCEVWLGGETEDPLYDGHATQYCRFTRGGCTMTFARPSSGGPASSALEACTR